MKITSDQVEKIRLLMSTYQDGTGQLRVKEGTLPNWRDFERTVATVFQGYAFENKGFIDVIIDGKTIGNNGKIGISCKMRNTLTNFNSAGSISLELTNALNKFWSELQKNEIETIRSVRLVPDRTGKIIVDLYESWKYGVADTLGIDVEESFYLTCLYDQRKGIYQLFALPFLLPDPKSLDWSLRESKDGDKNKGSLVAKRNGKMIIEWYGTSGGQLKYYPTKAEAIWHSETFTLEPIPNVESGYGLIQKAKSYFPQQWKF